MKNILKHATIVLDILFILVLLLNFLTYLPVFFNVLYIFYFVLAINTWFFALEIRHMPEHEKEHHSIVYLSKYFFLLGLALIVINQFLQKQIIIDYTLYIIGLVITFGFLTFYSSREKVEKEIENDKKSENDKESERKANFAYKFPRISKIPVFHYLIKWMYKEGWWYSLGLIIAILISLYFMLPGLGNFLSVDEPRWINAGLGHIMIPQNYDQAFNKDFIDSSYARSEAYWNSYLSGDFKSTLNNGNPSATINFLNLPGYLLKNHVDFNEYLIVSRLMIIVNNLILIVLLYFLIKRLTSKNQAITGFFMISLLPYFIGYSRIVNHDSVQGLYIIIFLLSFILALSVREKKYYVLSGIFLALSILTQYISEFLIPLLFFMVLVMDYFYKEGAYRSFINNIHVFLFFAFVTSVIILPASLFYPKIFLNDFLFYPKIMIMLATISGLILFTLYHPTKIPRVTISKNMARVITLGTFIAFIMLFTYLLVYTPQVMEQGVYAYPSESLLMGILGTFLVFLYSQPIFYLILLVLSLILLVYQAKIDLSFTLIFLFFILLLFSTVSSYDFADRGNGGFMSLDGRYIYVFLPILLIGIVSNKLFKMIPNKGILIIIIILAISGIYANLQFTPFYISYNNEFLIRGYLNTRTTWAIDTSETSKYINSNFENVTIYSPSGRLDPLIRNDVNVLPWYSQFWLNKPDYIIVEWEKSHQFSKILDYYREYETPIWVIKKNGAIYTGIYKFDANINYSEFGIS
jgi:hypothetical protein